ncbi:WxL domain-containing protein [Lacticaseibacillus hulanensis]|uniref:WxL domain-containing protein n=1 Tax=Lacticaseibacillus hulanensis TaxID=2493111 RepID=UPI0030C819FD
MKSAPTYKFGSLALKASGDTTKTVAAKTAVTVENPGIAATWAVGVKMGAFTGYTVEDGNEVANDATLTGATLDITSTGVTNTTTTEDSLLPVAKSFTLAGDGQGAANDVLVASKAGSAFQGIGTTKETTSATITVPAGNAAGNYKANLTWTLTADPTSALEVTPEDAAQ